MQDDLMAQVYKSWNSWMRKEWDRGVLEKMEFERVIAELAKDSKDAARL